MSSISKVKLESTPIPTKPHHWAHEDSVMRQLMNANVGQTIAKVDRLDASTTTLAAVNEVKTKMSNTVSGQINKVRALLDHSDKTFTISIGYYFAKNGDAIVCTAVTRTA